MDADTVLRDFDAGRARGLARAISWAESGRGADLVRHVYPRAGRALTIGLTGGIGSGKSTVTKILAELGALVAESGVRCSTPEGVTEGTTSPSE